LNERSYIDYAYQSHVDTGLSEGGESIAVDSGYFGAVKYVNSQLEPLSEEIINKSMDLIHLKAELTTEEGLRDSASTEIEKTR
jgi:uncharacterized protein YaaR (DUF327 family)